MKKLLSIALLSILLAPFTYAADKPCCQEKACCDTKKENACHCTDKSCDCDQKDACTDGTCAKEMEKK